MRITQGMLTDRLLADLRLSQADLARTQSEISSGRKLTRAGDDPVAVRDALLRRGELEAIAAQRDGVSSATTWLESTDTALGRVGDLLARAKELAVQGANGSMAQADREKIALEIDQLAQAAKDAMNARLGGVRIFSGTATGTEPYPAGSDTYAGDAGVVARQVGPGVSVQVNVLGSAVLGNGQTAGDGLVLDALRDVAQHLRGGTTADLDALRTTDLAALDANIDSVATARAGVGATQNRVDAAAARLDELEQVTETVLAGLEATDYAEALTRLSSQRTVYEAALRAGSQVMPISLMDFLR